MSWALPGLVSRLHLRAGGRVGRVRLRAGRPRCSLFCQAVPGQLDACHERQIPVQICTPQHTGEKKRRPGSDFLFMRSQVLGLDASQIFNVSEPVFSLVSQHCVGMRNFYKSFYKSGVTCSDSSTFVQEVVFLGKENYFLTVFQANWH